MAESDHVNTDTATDLQMMSPQKFSDDLGGGLVPSSEGWELGLWKKSSWWVDDLGQSDEQNAPEA